MLINVWIKISRTLFIGFAHQPNSVRLSTQIGSPQKVCQSTPSCSVVDVHLACLWYTRRLTGSMASTLVLPWSPRRPQPPSTRARKLCTTRLPCGRFSDITLDTTCSTGCRWRPPHPMSRCPKYSMSIGSEKTSKWVCQSNVHSPYR